jgi:hypothetical protein
MNLFESVSINSIFIDTGNHLGITNDLRDRNKEADFRRWYSLKNSILIDEFIRNCSIELCLLSTLMSFGHTFREI